MALSELLPQGISYLYVDTFRERDLFSQEFLYLFFTCVCTGGPSQIWRIPVEPLVCMRVTRYMRNVTDSCARILRIMCVYVCVCGNMIR